MSVSSYCQPNTGFCKENQLTSNLCRCQRRCLITPWVIPKYVSKYATFIPSHFIAFILETGILSSAIIDNEIIHLLKGHLRAPSWERQRFSSLMWQWWLVTDGIGEFWVLRGMVIQISKKFIGSRSKWNIVEYGSRRGWSGRNRRRSVIEWKRMMFLITIGLGQASNSSLHHETAYILCVPSSILSSMSRLSPSTSQNPFPRHSTQPSQPSTPNWFSCPFTALLYQLYSASILGAVECRDKAKWKVDSDDGEGRSE